MTKNIKNIAPWVVAAAIFAYLFHIYPPANVWEAMKLVNVWAFSSFAIFYFLFLFACDSISMQRVISRFSNPVEMGDIFQARGATYLVMVLSYPASQAAFAYFLKRRYGTPIFQALGIFFFIVIIDIVWIASLAFAGSFFQELSVGGVDLGRTVRISAAAIYAVLFLWIALWSRWPERILKRPIRISFIEKIMQRRAFHVFRQARLADYARVALMRAPIHIVIIISMYIVIHTFGVHVPFAKILCNVPIVFFIGTLPITPSGLGTTNALMVELLGPYLSGAPLDARTISPKELVFASTLLWMFANFVLKVLVGAALLKRASRAVFKPTPDVPEEVAEHDAAHVGGNI